MSWVEKHGPAWRIRDRVGGRVSTIDGGYPTKSAARTAQKAYDGDQVRGDTLVPRGGQTLLNDWIDEWLPGYEASLKPTAVHSELGRVRNHIRPLLGHLQLDDVDAVTVQRWIKMLSDGTGAVPAGSKWARRKLAPKTVHNCHGVLFTIMKAAVGQKLIRTNPCVGNSLPRREPREMRFLSDPEIARLIAALPEHWRPLVLLLVATGLRWGEAIGLKGGRVDLLARPPRLVVVEQMQEMSGTGDLIFMSPKSARSRRTVSFTKQVAMSLTGIVAAAPTGELIFRTATGLPVRTRNFRRIWSTATATAGLAGLRVHDLRHTHAAILISAGRPLSAISRRLGHSSIAVTDVLYGHIREEADEGILDAIRDALASVATDELAAEVEDELVDEAA